MNENLSSGMLDINTNKQKTKQVIGTYLKSLIEIFQLASRLMFS